MAQKYFYETKLIAFIDIMGFKNIINTEKGEAIEKIINCIDESLEQYCSCLRNGTNNLKDFTGCTILDIKHPKYCLFSDSIFFYIEDEENNLIRFLFSLTHLQRTFIEKNIFIRGGLVKGQLFEDNRKDRINILGPGVINAHDMESKIANYPRIIIEKKLVTKLKSTLKKSPLLNIKGYLPRHVLEDNQGNYFLDYLSAPIALSGLQTSDINFFENHKKFILESLENPQTNDEEERNKVISRFLMLANYHNFVVGQINNNQPPPELLIQMKKVENIFFKRPF